ncbi:MAG: cyclic nucleotide-binding domain-containing protein [Clostridiales bacterium]|nr:cyclic nucleotide-binding domain-containing protein [Clostridiales bacterium]
MSLTEKTFKNGEEIIKAGDIGRSFFLLTEGKAGVYADYEKNNPFRIAVLEPGEYFGEMAILEAYPRNATVVAVGNVHVIEITADELQPFFNEHPEQVFELMKHLGSRIHTMTDDYNESQALLKEVHEADTEKKSESFFSKIKKHISLYQSNKNTIAEPNTESLQKSVSNSAVEESDDMIAFQKGMPIFNEGEIGESMYILRSGSVGLYKNYGESDQIKSSELTAVSVFGVMGMVNEEPRSATAIAESDNTLIEYLDQNDIQDLIHSDPGKIEMILRLMSYRLRRLNIEFLKNCKEITESYDNK